MQKEDNLKIRIINDLKNTGFPLEVAVTNTLNSANWMVTSSPLYIDPDDKSIRELDVYALKIYNKEPREHTIENPNIFSHLIIQCKKSSKPWIFFDNAGNDHYWLGFYSLKCDNKDFMSRLCDERDVLYYANHRYKNVKRHKSFHVFKSEPKQPSQIYEALITSCKALEYYKNIYVTGNTAHFFTPIVVLDGTLWSATLDTKSQINLEQVKELVVKFDYIFGGDKRPNKYTYQYVEVITRPEFEKRISLIEADNKSLLIKWINILAPLVEQK